MKRAGQPRELTVDELVRYGPLSVAQILAGENLTRPVSQVALVSELDQVRLCEPGTAIVLSGTLAQGAWTVESALRLAWERSAACLVSPSVAGLTQTTAQLARRMQLPVFVVDGDMAACTVKLAAAIASPEAARARLAAHCAELFTERSSVRSIVGVMNSEVPGVSVALVAPDGRVLAGRASAADSEHAVRVDVPDPEGHRWGDLVAAVAGPPSRSWADTVHLILRLARAPLGAAVAKDHISAVHDSERGRVALGTLLRAPSGPVQETTRQGPTAQDQETQALAEGPFGWRVEGRHVAVFLRSNSTLDTAVSGPGVVSAWQETVADLPLVPWDTGWVSWWSGDHIDEQTTAKALRRVLTQMRSPVHLSGGVGRVAQGPQGLRESVSQAALAAAVTVRQGHGTVRSFDELGYQVMLAALSQRDLRHAARIVLRDLLTAPDGTMLVITLAALLDCSNSTSQAAARLGVHRNTVLGRVERIRARGIDLDHPDQRLALHLACYAVLPDRG
ncbi:PucR family transcriptional regulator [Streptomyces sp. MS06]|uniref:PucR family transcriptional regulator n=1 Tax=Streptomyces sp. MS06 TaxID=3385974 RepID=UPI00399FA276